MPSITEVRATNAAFESSYIPVILITGGTSGIGQAIAEEFAKITKGNAHIILLGRNRAAAESIISSFPEPTSAEAVHEFVECDVSSIKNVEKTIQSLLSRLPRLNFLVLSAGAVDLKGRVETEEGIDKKLALAYYSRWKFVHDFAPLLQKAKDEDQVASAMSVLGPVRSGKIDLDDLGMKKHYSVLAFARSAASYTDLMIEAFASRYPTVSFIHIYPGTVRTPMLNFFSHWALRPLNWLFKLLVYPISVTPEYCAQYMLWALLSTESGASRRDERGKDLGNNPYYSGSQVVEKLWNHTEAEVERALAVP